MAGNTVFNIIYTPGTVQYLRLFVFSLLKWSEVSFRLVSNGCLPEEARLLRKLCQSPRIEFLALPSRTVMRHDQALNYLQSLERSETFCFMDSDILATGEFPGEMPQCAGVFSAPPVWCRAEEQIMLKDLPFLTGRFSSTAEGLCLGNTYFAIYDNEALSQIIQSTGVGFELCQWKDIPDQWQSRIAGMGLKKRKYDTGKVLNLLLLAQGKELTWVESPSLHHIGGISTYTVHQTHSLPKRFLTKLKLIDRRIRVKIEHMTTKDTALADARAKMWQVRKKETKAVNHFTQVLHALFQKRPLPATPRLGDPEIEARIESVAMDIASTFEEFKEHL